MITDDQFRTALAHPLERTDFPNLGRFYEGKVRDNYILPDEKRRILITTDRISAFDRVLTTLPFKGQILSQMAVYWFHATRHIVGNHLLAAPDPNVMVAVECEPLPLEVVVRGYLTGVTSTSIWTAYKRGDRVFCGHQLPDGMRQHQKLPHPIVTPSTKAAKGSHDVSVAGETLIRDGVISEADFQFVHDKALELFAFGTERCARQGMILVDTKYEFGRTPDGEIVLMDEIHTPDSSRFWYAEQYEKQPDSPVSFDKEYVRRWLADQNFKGDGEIPPIPDEIRIEAAKRYLEAYERVVGRPLNLDLSPPIPRIGDAIAVYMHR